MTSGQLRFRSCRSLRSRSPAGLGPHLFALLRRRSRAGVAALGALARFVGGVGTPLPLDLLGRILSILPLPSRTLLIGSERRPGRFFGKLFY